MAGAKTLLVNWLKSLLAIDFIIVVMVILICHYSTILTTNTFEKLATMQSCSTRLLKFTAAMPIVGGVSGNRINFWIEELHPLPSMEDTTGYSVSCTSQAALDWFNKGLTAFVSLYGNSMTFFNKAVEVDPEFLLAHCVLVCLYFPA